MPPPTMVEALTSVPSGNGISWPLPTKVMFRSAVAPPVIRPPEDMLDATTGPATIRAGQEREVCGVGQLAMVAVPSA